MNSLLKPLTSALIGGLVVAGTFLALGVTGRRTTQTVVEEAPMAAEPSTNTSQELTAHAIYVRDAPGVVFIRAQVTRQVPNPFALAPSRPQTTSTGSGFVLDRAGHILTTYDVVAGADADGGVTVEFGDGSILPATVIGTDPSEDLAVLRVNPRRAPYLLPLALGDSTTVRVGDPTLAIGNPFGSERTLVSGIVSALQGDLPAPDGTAIDNVIQTEMPIDPGNSGGPLLDADGRVIGVNSQVMEGGSSSARAGIAFAVPIDTAKALLSQLQVRSRACASGLRCGSGTSRSQDQVLRNHDRP